MLRLVCCLWFVFFTAFPLFCQPVHFTIDLKQKAQTIDNFGASGTWFSEHIGKNWPDEKKEHLARLLFSKELDQNGNPVGIGLSAWRFNIGGGTAEQGDSSGIGNLQKRVECFLSPDGSYNWNKQQGYLWFVKKAAFYGVKDLIAFSNTPPVQFTKNGLGFKTEKSYETNLKEDKYNDYATFMATVVQHFEKEGLRFRYISPVNEPQWEWSGKFGKMSQEGSPWHNRDIYKIVVSLDSVLSAKKLSTKILVTEAGDLSSLYEGKGYASNQIPTFFAPSSPFYLGNLKHLHPVVEGHSYFTDAGDTMIVSVRNKLKEAANKFKLPYWQSEYSLLGNGYKEGVRGRRTAMDCALFLAKVIYHDLTVANATAWHFWNSWEPGRADVESRYYLVALKNDSTNTSSDFAVTKNLWALGHFSRFIRPGMQRLLTSRSDGLNEIQAAKDLMVTAFTNGKKIIVVAVNYTTTDREINLKLLGLKKVKAIKQFVTTAKTGDNMTRYPLHSLEKISLQPRSLVTIQIDVD